MSMMLIESVSPCENLAPESIGSLRRYCDHYKTCANEFLTWFGALLRKAIPSWQGCNANLHC
jgi:hypothetical protein